MEFFCPSCGSANKTNISTGKSKLKTCGNCQNDFLAGDNNRAVSMESTTTIKACPHVFCHAEGVRRLWFGSALERGVFLGVVIAGMLVITIALLSAWLGG